jgi:nicotinamide-nucleotide amidase
MRIELINTGTELLLGEVINTHAAYVGEKLRTLGLGLTRQVAVPDGEPIRESLQAARDAQIIIATGGLGPTPDDVTREIAAALYGLRLLPDEDFIAALTARMEQRGHVMTENNRRQGLVPEGATLLPNPHGTAPGLHLPATDDMPDLFLLPGPPRELYPMFENHVLPRISEIAGGTRTLPESCTWTLYGLGESQVAQKIGDTLENLPGMHEVGYRLGPKVDINLRCFGTDTALEQAGQLVEEHFAEQLISTSGECMEEVVVRLLGESNATLATAESCTGGLVAHRITNVPGASEVFTHGFVTYSNEAKTGLLGVPKTLLESHGAVSEPVARAMAEGVLRVSSAHCAIAVTGIAGPGGGSEEKPVGTVFIALAGRDGTCFCERFFYPHEREHFKLLTSQRALDLVRRHLTGLPFAN